MVLHFSACEGVNKVCLCSKLRIYGTRLRLENANANRVKEIHLSLCEVCVIHVIARVILRNLAYVQHVKIIHNNGKRLLNSFMCGCVGGVLLPGSIFIDSITPTKLTSQSTTQKPRVHYTQYTPYSDS